MAGSPGTARARASASATSPAASRHCSSMSISLASPWTRTGVRPLASASWSPAASKTAALVAVSPQSRQR